MIVDINIFIKFVFFSSVHGRWNFTPHRLKMLNSDMKEYDVIILHGWMQSKEDWIGLQKQLEELPEIKRIVTLDLPGFGNEPLISPLWGVPEYASWVEAKIQQKKHKNVILLGHSFGGRITSCIASNNPSYLKAIILSGAPCLYRPNKKTKVRNKIFKTFNRLTVLPAIKKKFYSEELAFAQNKGMDKILKKVINFDQTDILKKIKLPTLLIWGENDVPVPITIATEMHSLIKNSQLSIIKQAGHNSFASHPYLFFGYVKKFISQINE